MSLSLLTVSARVRVYSVPGEFAHADGTPLDDNELRRHATLVSDGHNLIVNNGRDLICKLIGHALGSPSVGGQSVTGIADLQIAKMKIGNAVNPSTPSATDTALADGTPLVTLTSLTVSYPTTSSVRFRATIPVDTQNGEGLTEAGLFAVISSTDVMLGRRIINPPVVVSPGTAYQFDYDIALAAS